MPDAISTPGFARFQRVLTAYLQTNRRDAKELITKKAQSAAVSFYQETQKAAPDPAKIKADVLALGWRVKRKPGAWPRKKGEKRGSKGPLNRMRAAVIKRRQRARGVVATGWLPAVKKLGGKPGGKKLAEVRNPRGRVAIEQSSPDVFTVTVANSTPGIVKVEQKHRILKKGFDAGTKDMVKYLRQKRAGGSGRNVGGNQ
jgi:hypothetical protein